MAEGREGKKVKLVIDASVATKWIIPGEPWEEEADALKNAIASGSLEAYAPTLIIYELASAMSKAIRNNVLKTRDGTDALEAVGSLGIKLTPILWREAAEILEAATTSGLTVYDSAYLWLSRRLGGRLVTADEKLKEKGATITETILLGELELNI
ncbi:MAG: type II toxin-antitoxin system VapC family toxin [Thermoproteota archaeon]